MVVKEKKSYGHQKTTPDGVKPLYTIYKNKEFLYKRDVYNKRKEFKYGYNKEFNFVCISKTGKVGDVYIIEGLKIALPLYEEKELVELPNNYWERQPIPKELSKIKSSAQFEKQPNYFQEKYIPYINTEYDRRANGIFFKNKNKVTYITGSHYMYLQWGKIDVGYPDFREANRILYIYWEACKADHRCYGMIYLKIRRSGASFMGVSEANNISTISKNSIIGMLSNNGENSESLFTNKTIPLYFNYPFFFKPIQAGMDKPKKNIEFDIPATRITNKNYKKIKSEEISDIEGLGTVMNWKATSNGAYDSEKLAFVICDEYGKWEKPNNIRIHWEIMKKCLFTGFKKVGSAFVISTCGAKSKGGKEYEELYKASNPLKRDENGETVSGLYKLFIPFEWNYEGTIDRYGMPVFHNIESNRRRYDSNGNIINKGAINWWVNRENALKNDPIGLNSHYRDFPRREEHAFRNEASESPFNVAKIYEQVEYINSLPINQYIHKGNFFWKNDIPDGEVEFRHADNGRFLLSWIPPRDMQNAFYEKDGRKYPLNKDIGAFGCDPYDISKTSDGVESNGAIHGKTGFHSYKNIPQNSFFLEYIDRPPIAEIFFDDVIKCCLFYGMQILVENNVKRLLYEMKNRGLRGFSMNRPDKHKNKLSPIERELGGITSSSEDVRVAHAIGIETYIERNIGFAREDDQRPTGDIGDFLFTRTLEDWALFDISKRTKRDASISSGLAIMATNKNIYTTKTENSNIIKLNLKTYNNKGIISNKR